MEKRHRPEAVIVRRHLTLSDLRQSQPVPVQFDRQPETAFRPIRMMPHSQVPWHFVVQRLPPCFNSRKHQRTRNLHYPRDGQSTFCGLPGAETAAASQNGFAYGALIGDADGIFSPSGRLGSIRKARIKLKAMHAAGAFVV